MLKNYMIVAYRGFRRNVGFGLMSVASLAVGIAACLFILLYIEDENSYDRMYGDADRIYRIVEARNQADGGVQHAAFTAGPMASTLRTTLPEVEESVGILGVWALGRRTVRRGETWFYEAGHLVAGPEFFEIFDFDFVRGTPEGALDEPLEAVLTDEMAARYFGAEDPVGKVLAVESLGDVRVTGVLKRPVNTHLDFSMVLSYASLLQYQGFVEWLESWGSTAALTFVKLREGADVLQAERKVAELAARHFEEADAERRVPYLQALTDIHFGSSHIQSDRNHNPGQRAYVYIFSAVALFVLLIACINYMNMATARSMRRAREIGMRKALGAGRFQLMAQFLAESFLTTLVALGLALLIVWALLPWFNALAGKAVTFTTLKNANLLVGIAALVLTVGLLAGSYPALYLSRLRPSRVLKGAVTSGRSAAVVRRGLVVSQFALSIFLVSATLVVQDQLDFFQSKPLGFDEEQLIVVDINSGSVRRDFDAVKQAMELIPSVQSVSVSNRVPGDWKGIPQVDARHAGATESEVLTVRFLGVDDDFLDTYRIDLLSGAGFSGYAAVDSTSLLVNATAARLLRVGEGDRLALAELEFEGTIIGVVDDFHFESLHEEIAPMVIGYRTNPLDVIDYFTVRFEGDDLHATVAALRSIGERFDPEHPFEYNFLDARLEDYYANDQRVRRIFGAAAGIAIALACLGLFGLATYVAERRTKEIGIRKVMGATATGIVSMLTSEFARPVLLAFLIAAPIAYLGMDWWLREFPYRVSVDLATLAEAGAAALAVALLTVSYQALKAARTNPARCLQYE